LLRSEVLKISCTAIVLVCGLKLRPEHYLLCGLVRKIASKKSLDGDVAYYMTHGAAGTAAPKSCRILESHSVLSCLAAAGEKTSPTENPPIYPWAN
jgi:hypothetical protein